MNRLTGMLFLGLALWLYGCAQGLPVSGLATGRGAGADVPTES